MTGLHPPTLLVAARAVGLVVSAPRGRLAIRGPKGAAGLARLLLSHAESVARLVSESGPERTPGPVPPSWQELVEIRWGPAADDPTAGLVIDRPDRDRLRVALEAIDDDPHTHEERSAIQAEGGD